MSEKITCQVCKREKNIDEMVEIDGYLICSHHPYPGKSKEEKKKENKKEYD